MDPSRRCELGGPDDVELQHVWNGSVRIEPLDVELMPLIGGVRRDAQFNLDVGMERVESSQLRAHHIRFGPERTPGKRQDCWTLRLPAAGEHSRRDAENRSPQARQHQSHSTTLRTSFPSW